jgi:hypothetical protein
MKKINFSSHILPHAIAIGIFLIVTVLFFSPIFFDNKTLEQGDIQQFLGSSKSIVDYRTKTGEEALWTNSMFSGMPAYLVSVQWGNQVLGYLKGVFTLGLPSPTANIFVAFLSYYILLLVFGIRPYFAIAGALAFGLSSYLIIGVLAGHNARIGAIAFLPLLMAGVHLAFSGKRILGLGITTVALAMHLRENHLQITYYLIFIIGAYGIVRLTEAIKEKTLPDFLKNTAVLIPAAILAACTNFGQLWAVTEYTSYSIRGKSELLQTGEKSTDSNASGLTRERAFEYSNGILEPLTLLIPNFYGGSTSNFLVQDQKSETYKALVNANDNQLANQLVNYSSSYWGPQFNTAPYYAGAILVFLFAIGIAFADKKYIWWLVPISVLGIVLSWGSSFPSFNYFLFDYLPGYNKFRSVTFTLVIVLFSMPLLGFLGLEKLFSKALDKVSKKKLLIAFSATGGLCLLLLIFAGMFSFTRDVENQLPDWFVNALAKDRISLFRADAFRSFAFITSIFVILYFNLYTKIAPIFFYAFLIFMIIIDLSVVDKRYVTSNNYKRKRDNTFFAPTEADQIILQDKSNYRVYNLQGTMSEAKTSYLHQSIGGYHGAKMRRYQDFYDSCLVKQTQQLITNLQQGRQDFNYGAINMLNIKYMVFGTQRENIIPNSNAYGNAWFVKEIIKVNSATEELEKTCSVNAKDVAVIDESKFKTLAFSYDSTATIALKESKPNYLKYESQSTSDGLAVFSEIYYPKGWKATVDGKESEILRADYILRALQIPAGQHVVEFRFVPDAYVVGNKITTVSSWLVLLVLLMSLGWSLKKD